MNETREAQLINSMNADEYSAKILADYLDYTVGKNPINPESNLRIYFTDKTDNNDSGVIAVLPVEDLNEKSSTVEVRKLYEHVIDIKDNQLNLEFTVAAVGFIGKKRLVFFPILGGNRDTRLDLNPDTIDVDLYKRNFNYLRNENIYVESSPFGSEDQIKIDAKAFRRELSSNFLTMVSMYRKKLSEWITASDLKTYLYDLVSDQAKVYIKRNDINNLVQSDSYKSVLSTVVDTISLRQLMRRFLEGYYGADSFNVDGIALGVGNGTLDEAIEKAVTIAQNVSEESKIKKLNRQKTPIGQLSLFDNGFTPDELDATSHVQINENSGDYLTELSKKASEQFKLAYGGDLFAGSIGEVATKIDQELAKQNKLEWVKPYVDTKAGNYSFRFEDMPPEAIEKQYEDSMSQNVQITLDKKTNKPVVFFGDDEVEQKNKGAYYTDQRFVDYMVKQTVSIEFQNRYQDVKKAVESKENEQIAKALDHLLDLKIADFTCGGGSFLRGAFLELADQYQLLAGLDYPQEIKDKYNFLNGSKDSQYQWEDYILKHMIYGVDIDYKAIIISSLTLTLSSLQHKPKNTKLPQLIGRTLIHQNTLFNAVPYYKREKVFKMYQKDIERLRRLKSSDFNKFIKLRDELTAKVIPEAGDVAKYASFLEIGCIEFALPEIFFNEDGSLNVHGGLDIVIGNPPWEAWKPNSDEFFSEYDVSYRRLPNKKAKKHLEKILFDQFPTLEKKWSNVQERIKAGSKYIRSEDSFHYQSWVVNGKKASSDLNLYKVSLERFTQLAKPNAQFSILVPDNFATDNGSTGLRHLVLDDYNLQEFLSFANRRKIFPAVDERYKFAVLTFNRDTKNDDGKFKAFFYKLDLDLLNNNSSKLNYSISFLKQMEPERYAMVEAHNQDLLDLFEKLRLTYKPLRDSNLIKLGNDFHRTNDADKFINKEEASSTDLPLYEGKYMNQFQIFPSKIAYRINQDNAKAKLGDDYHFSRIALRSVASSTNKRSLIATLLPANSVATNSLNIQKDPQKMKDREKLFFLGFLNSYVFDFVLRQLISININQIYLKQLPLPQLNDVKDADIIIQIVKALLQKNKGYYTDLDESIPGNAYRDILSENLIAELNARVMINFKMTRQEIITLMETFKTKKHTKDVDADEQRILNKYDQLTGGAK